MRQVQLQPQTLNRDGNAAHAANVHLSNVGLFDQQNPGKPEQDLDISLVVIKEFCF